MRTIALGRKNYLFARSDTGGERAASIYTLIGTAKLNCLDPELYLRTVLERIAEHPINRIHDLLRWKLAATPTTLLKPLPTIVSTSKTSWTRSLRPFKCQRGLGMTLALQLRRAHLIQLPKLLAQPARFRCVD